MFSNTFEVLLSYKYAEMTLELANVGLRQQFSN